MIVIADTSALNYLVRTDQVEILQKLYGRVIIPHAVLNEMRATGAPLVVSLWALNLPNWNGRRSVLQSRQRLTFC